MDLDITVKVKALEQLLNYVASGIGSVAGPVLAPWQAQREAKAKQITAEGEARVLLIQAKAQTEARELLISQDANVSVEFEIDNRVQQRIRFQEQKRQANIESVVRKAANELGDKPVVEREPDHDWTARFFSSIQDVSSEDMQLLWAKVLAGEVERAGSTSIRTLEILRNLDQATARLFTQLCSVCAFRILPDGEIFDARVPSLQGHPAQNSLRVYGLSFSALNQLNEHGLIISDYNSWIDYNLGVRVKPDNIPILVGTNFFFQKKHWVLVSMDEHDLNEEFKLNGVALSFAGKELSRIVSIEPMKDFAQAFTRFLEKQKLKMVEVRVFNALTSLVSP